MLHDVTLRRKNWLVAVGMFAIAAVLTWPIGLGGRMPIGGDSARFSIGLMGAFDRALADGRLPTWNPLWGFGFPGVAESQMGVYYGPHWLLYGLLSTEWAYSLGLVVHAAIGALGAAWAARRFGASTTASALAGLAFAGSGFFAIHRTHPWAFEVGCWMPWIWGLGWSLTTGRGGARTWLALASLLAIQVLPGHFQLAFETQVGLVVLMVAGWPGRGDRSQAKRWAVGTLGIGFAFGFAALLAMAQILPTWRLARLAESSRTFDYLAGFATFPGHLISYVAPLLFHRSPLWRPIVWDPFHASPEEHLGYLGLAPLFLAILAVWRGVRSDRAVRALTILVVSSLLLSFGPYLPGFRPIAGLPGFRLFRAPARWGLVSMLGLAILAALGLDRLRITTPHRRGWLGFASLAAALVLLTIGMVELAMASTDRPGLPGIASGFNVIRGMLPWENDPDFHRIMQSARVPVADPLNMGEVRRLGVDPRSTFEGSRGSIYLAELGPSALILLGLLATFALARGGGRLAAGLIGLTALDLIWCTRLLAPETAPIVQLSRESRVLSVLSERVPGGRILDPFGNLAMVAGLAPLRAYRTLDLPTLQSAVGWAESDSDRGDQIARILGVSAWVAERDPRAGSERVQIVEDRPLATWIYGSRWLEAEPWRIRFEVRIADEKPPRAFLTGLDLRTAPSPSEEIQGILDLARDSVPIASREPRPDRIEVGPIAPGTSTRREQVVVSTLFDPQWRGEWTGVGWRIEAMLVPIFGPESGAGGWIGAPRPSDQVTHLSLRYDARAERIGLAVSASAWSAWFAGWVWIWMRGRRRRRLVMEQSA